MQRQTKKNRLSSTSVLDGFDIAGQSPEQACERLAKSHYENFTVGSFLLPKRLRKHFYNIYAYCRVCDDLADETNDRELSLKLLGWWRDELHMCYAGTPQHPAFKTLAETIEQFDIPMQPFEDLIDAFVQDQHVTRYDTFEQLLCYCERSANPVGRLLLHILGYRDAIRQELSDCTCTALQLANFWQDIASDYDRGRIYIPQEDMREFGYSEVELKNHIVNASFVRLMQFEIARTRELFERGNGLAATIDGTPAADIELFTCGGMAALRAIEQRYYDIYGGRAAVSKSKKALMITHWCLRRFSRTLRAKKRNQQA